MTEKELKQYTCDVIRRKISAFDDESNNDEISGFVKGVIALERELYMSVVEKEQRLTLANINNCVK